MIYFSKPQEIEEHVTNLYRANDISSLLKGLIIHALIMRCIYIYNTRDNGDPQ